MQEYVNENYDPANYIKAEDNQEQKKQEKKRKTILWHPAVRVPTPQEEIDRRCKWMHSPEFLEAHDKNVKTFGKDIAEAMLRRIVDSWRTKEIEPAKTTWK